MKKRFISLVAAAALVGGIAVASTPATSQAGTVAVKGDTVASMYGFIRYEAGWAKKMGGIYATTPTDKTKEAKTNFESNAEITRIGFTFKNADANVCGRIEGDFWGTKFRLRRAYVKHSFDNFYVLVGQDWGVEVAPTYSAAWAGVAGFGGNGRSPQIKAGTNLDLGGATLSLAVALEDIDYTNVTAPETTTTYTANLSTGAVTATESTSSGVEITRKTMPSVAAKVNIGIDTGFGSPASVYAFGMATPLKLTVTDAAGNAKEKTKTPVIFGAGFELPVSMVAIQANYLYGKGANGYANSSDAPDSYWVDSNGSLKTSKFYAWNIEGKVTPMACVSVAAGYDYVKFKDYDTGNPKLKNETYFANLGVKTTKYTKLVLEWDHTKAKETGSDSYTGNRYWFNYTYSF